MSLLTSIIHMRQPRTNRADQFAMTNVSIQLTRFLNKLVCRFN